MSQIEAPIEIKIYYFKKIKLSNNKVGIKIPFLSPMPCLLYPQPSRTLLYFQRLYTGVPPSSLGL